MNDCPVRMQAIMQPDAIAITSDKQQLTFAQLDQQICDLSEQLFKLGLTSGDRLICIATNSLQLLLLQLTCLRHAIIFSPINPHFSRQEIETRINLLASEFIWHQQTDSALGYPSLPLDFSRRCEPVSGLSPYLLDASKAVNIIFTSGSSGTPKAAMHCFSNHFYSAIASQERISLNRGDINLLSLPLFHISGYATVIRTIMAGATLLIDTQKLSVNLLKEKQITHLSLVAKQLYELLQHDQFQHQALAIKHLLLGGSAFSQALLQQTAERGFCYHLSYGLTEMSSQVATSTNTSELQILKYAQIKIVEGEIYLRGKTRFMGYFNNAVDAPLIAAESWFATKDLGRLDNGLLQIVGRKDRQFICAGENIQPEEIERLLIEHPAINQAHVVSLEHPSFGQQPVAFIAAQRLPSHQQLNDYLTPKLSRYKRPLYYFPMPEQSGLKISYQQLQQIAQQTVITTQEP